MNAFYYIITAVITFLTLFFKEILDEQIERKPEMKVARHAESFLIVFCTLNLTAILHISGKASMTTSIVLSVAFFLLFVLEYSAKRGVIPFETTPPFLNTPNSWKNKYILTKKIAGNSKYGWVVKQIVTPFSDLEHISQLMFTLLACFIIADFKALYAFIAYICLTSIVIFLKSIFKLK